MMWPSSIAFVPSPIPFDYDESYLALANKSGRMQYYREPRGHKRERVGRTDFLQAFNKHVILALVPIQSSNPVFQFKFFIKFRS